jgi:predicted nicotinamide N-methyase
MTPREFVLANTRLGPVLFVPEIRLHLAEETFALWERTQAFADAALPPPFWAFAWGGGQALARYVLDHPEIVSGRRVLDVASGSGLVAIAAVMAGAAHVTANDIDPLAVAAIPLNAAANSVSLDVLPGDLLDDDGGDAEVVLAGDVFYEQALADRAVPFLERTRARGALVLAGDPDRAYLPRRRFEVVAAYDVPVTRAIEAASIKRATVWRPRLGDDPASA